MAAAKSPRAARLERAIQSMGPYRIDVVEEAVALGDRGAEAHSVQRAAEVGLPIRVVARGDPGGMSLSEVARDCRGRARLHTRSHAGDAVVAWLAAHHGRVCIVGAVRFDSDDMNCEMVLPRAPDDLTSEMTAQCFPRLERLHRQQDGACGWYACRSRPGGIPRGSEIGGGKR